MSKTTKLVPSFDHEIEEGFREPLNAQKAMAHHKAAVMEQDEIFGISEDIASGMAAALHSIQDSVYQQVQDAAKDLGLNDKQAAGMLLNAAFGAYIETVDQMRSDYHPVYRAMYASAIMRSKLRETVKSTTLSAAEAGLLTEEQVIEVVAVYDHVDNNPPPICNHKHDMAPHHKVEARRVADILQTMTDSIPDPEERARLTERIKQLRQRHDLDDDSEVGYIETELDADGNIPDAALQQIVDRTGGRTTIETLRKAIQSSRPVRGESDEDEYRTVVVPLDKEENDE